MIPFNESFASEEKSNYWSPVNVLTPDQVKKNSIVKFKFICHVCSHEFLKRPKDVVEGSWCQYCIGRAICDDADCDMCFERSFLSHPKAEYWSDKNELTPRQVFKSTAKKYWFMCVDCGHTFDISLDHITCPTDEKSNWCRYCNSFALCDDISCAFCFEKSFASHPMAKYWSDKNKYTARQICKSGNKECWFDCHECSHTFSSNLSNIVYNGQWCGYCAKNALCADENCEFCFEKSFASHPKAVYWSDKNDTTPRQHRKYTKHECLFECDVCNHTIKQILSNISGNDQWCGYCGDTLLCDSDDCQFCFDKSFASCEYAQYWHPSNMGKPRDYRKHTDITRTFSCPSCPHTFSNTLSHISDGERCSYCRKKKLCDDMDCEMCYKNSFLSHPMSEFYSLENKLTSRQIFKYSCSKTYIFDCYMCNTSFLRTASSVSTGQWCPNCENTTEKKVYDKLLDVYPTIRREFSASWCVNPTSGKKLPFDFIIPELNILIELDGPQHFVQVSNWKSPDITHARDLFKMKCANANQYSVIRLTQAEVREETFNWFSILCDAIAKVKVSPQNFYICVNNEYDHWDEELSNAEVRIQEIE